jgi:hypothetical protein
MRRTIALAAVGLLALVGLTACGGGDGDSVTIEKDGESVEVDRDGGSVSFKSDDGDASTTVGDDAKVPEDWPDDVPLPDGGKVAVATQVERDGKQTFHLTYKVSDDADDVIADYGDALKDGGFTLDNESSWSGGSGSVGVFEATGHGWKVTVLTIGSSDANSLSIQVSEAA